jgi:hypothetical protein
MKGFTNMGDLLSQTLKHYSSHCIETISEYIRDCRMQEYPRIYGPDIFFMGVFESVY